MAYWTYLHVDWTPRISETKARILGRRLRAIDYDFDSGAVFSDGIRLEWRASGALLTLDGVRAELYRVGIDDARGWHLPLGAGCIPGACGRAAELGPGAVCELGGTFACRPTPRPEEWFHWKTTDTE